MEVSTTLTLTLHNNRINLDNVDDIFKNFAKVYKKQIKDFCNITRNTEWQISNFGLGSAWLFESPYKFKLSFSEYTMTLEIEGSGEVEE